MITRRNISNVDSRIITRSLENDLEKDNDTTLETVTGLNITLSPGNWYVSIDENYQSNGTANWKHRGIIVSGTATGYQLELGATAGSGTDIVALGVIMFANGNAGAIPTRYINLFMVLNVTVEAVVSLQVAQNTANVSVPITTLLKDLTQIRAWRCPF